MSEIKRRKTADRNSRAHYKPPKPAPADHKSIRILRNKLLNANTAGEIPAVSAERFQENTFQSSAAVLSPYQTGWAIVSRIGIL